MEEKLVEPTRLILITCLRGVRIKTGFVRVPVIKCQTCENQTHFYLLLALMALIKAEVLKIKNSLDKKRLSQP